MKTYYLRLLPKFVDIIIANANKTSNTGLPVLANAGSISPTCSSIAPAGFTSSPLPLSGTVSLLPVPLLGSVLLLSSVPLSGSVLLLFSASVTATISEDASSLDELTSFPLTLTVA